MLENCHSKSTNYIDTYVLIFKTSYDMSELRCALNICIFGIEVVALSTFLRGKVEETTKLLFFYTYCWIEKHSHHGPSLELQDTHFLSQIDQSCL